MEFVNADLFSKHIDLIKWTQNNSDFNYLHNSYIVSKVGWRGNCTFPYFVAGNGWK